jgi:arsenate reductase-like glutaredoxin family protein
LRQGEEGAGLSRRGRRRLRLVDAALVARFCDAFGWEAVVNTRGTTWRKLSDEVRAGVVDETSAIAVLVDNPSAIKRPILEAGHQWLIGFDPASWSALG